MSERPILFSAPMVRAILEGRKTQTRRIVKDQSSVSDIAGGGVEPAVWWPRKGDDLLSCRFGTRGDRLWVRETWKRRDDGLAKAWYRADGHIDITGWPWRPSIFMPRLASRLTLEITGVRVERLNDISEADAIAEGIPAMHPNNESHPELGVVAAYRSLWDSINGKKRPWASNPWVWVVEFRRIESV